MSLRSLDISSGKVTLEEFRSRDKISIICDYCSKEFSTNKHRIQSSWRKKSDRLLFCSGSCANLNRIKKVEVIINCSNQDCQKPIRRTKSTFLGRAFCDNSCAAKVINLGNRNNPSKERKCKTCSIGFFTTKHHRSQRLCPSCVQSRFTPEVAKALTIADYENRLSVKGKHVSWRASHIRLFNRSWNSQLQTLPCQQCGYDKHVELAHIKAVKDFSKSSKIGEVNDPSNLFVLCRNCHWELDNGHLQVADIKPR